MYKKRIVDIVSNTVDKKAPLKCPTWPRSTCSRAQKPNVNIWNKQLKRNQIDLCICICMYLYMYAGIHAQIGIGLHAPVPRIQDVGDIIWRKCQHMKHTTMYIYIYTYISWSDSYWVMHCTCVCYIVHWFILTSSNGTTQVLGATDLHSGSCVNRRGSWFYD